MRYRVKGRHFENRAFRDRWCVISWLLAGVYCVFRVKTLFSKFSGVVWSGPKPKHQGYEFYIAERTVADVFKVKYEIQNATLGFNNNSWKEKLCAVHEKYRLRAWSPVFSLYFLNLQGKRVLVFGQLKKSGLIYNVWLRARELSLGSSYREIEGRDNYNAFCSGYFSY